MTVVDLACNKAYSVDFAAKEGAGRFAFIAFSRPGRVEDNVYLWNRKPALTAIHCLQREF